MQIASLIKARFPLLYATTWEEQRLTDCLHQILHDEQLFRAPRELFIWSETSGLQSEHLQKKDLSKPLELLEFITRYQEAAIFVLRDFHVFLDNKQHGYDYSVIRKLRDILPELKNGGAAKTIIFTAPSLVLPLELQKDISVIDFPFPTREEILHVLNEMIAVNQDTGLEIRLTEEEKIRLAEAAMGLTNQEAENCFAKAIAMDGRLGIEDLSAILDEKAQIIKKTGVLEYLNPQIDLSDVGGLENLKKWVAVRSDSWGARAKSFGIDPPKGVLLTGVPGCGKSLISKAVSTIWSMPLLRLDIGSIFSSLLGSSEENMRKAIKTAEAIAPCVLWMDEIEKGFASVGGANDSGVSSRIFGTFLTWMQEKTSSVFVIATANDISSLPAEFLRKGRFDEIFFVDLPTVAERKQIFKVHLKKKLGKSCAGQALAVTDELLDRLADATEGFVGAEIEQAVQASLYEAFFDKRDVAEDDILRAIRNTVPLSVTQSEKILALRQWANLRAVAATKQEDRSAYVREELPQAQTEAAAIGRSRGGRTIDF